MPAPRPHGVFKYVHLTRFAHPWIAVAYILLYMRAGVDLPKKEDHQKVLPPSDDELNAVKDEMPPLMLAVEPEL